MSGISGPGWSMEKPRPSAGRLNGTNKAGSSRFNIDTSVLMNNQMSASGRSGNGTPSMGEEGSDGGYSEYFNFGGYNTNETKGFILFESDDDPGQQQGKAGAKNKRKKIKATQSSAAKAKPKKRGRPASR